MPRRPLPLRALVPALALLLAGCGGGREEVLVAWSFIDERDCAEAGVERVLLAVADQGQGSLRSARCSEGRDGRHVAMMLAPGETLSLAALSPAGAALYRGRYTAADPVPEVLPVTLVYSGGP